MNDAQLLDRMDRSEVRVVTRLERIEAKLDLVGDRVSRLELWRARSEGARSVVAAVVAAIVSFGVAIFAPLFTGK